MSHVIVTRFELRGTGHKKGLFPINNSQPATRNPQLVTRNTYLITKQTYLKRRIMRY